MLVIVLAVAALAYYFLTSNAVLERSLDLLEGNTTRSAPSTAPATTSAPVPAPADDAAALQKAGCRQSAEDLGLYRNGAVPVEIRPQDILSAEVRYCVETGILTKAETAGLDLSE
ncbi:hypothetical protein C5748_06015 [Phyllobacterium phragmitis]|uniref:Uncharacterized protein n=1 Tax=Phyllobacterium phragmitis TaxID=2670329 RepID=A0A2S9IUF0_9HYPH|nr:hypothetical protein [Phyllobacterium phragmitis]PRD44162.1 hypothetical protein C5748_06015 [Phyllobacterium phragmitis]